VGAHATARKLFEVGRGEFSPPPKVQSSVVELSRAFRPAGSDAALKGGLGRLYVATPRRS